MKILLSITACEAKSPKWEEYSRVVDLPLIPEIGRTVMVGQHKVVVKDIVLVADSEEVQVVGSSWATYTPQDLLKAGWRKTEDELYFEAKSEPEKKGKK